MPASLGSSARFAGVGRATGAASTLGSRTSKRTWTPGSMNPQSRLERALREQTRTLMLGLVGAMFTMTSLCLGAIALAV